MTATTLTITDNDPPPTVTLALSEPDHTIREGETLTVTAELNHPSSAATAVTVSATAVSPAVAADFRLSGTSLTIPAGATESTGSATLTAEENTDDEADKRITVTARAENPQGVHAMAVAPVTVTITDDDPPVVTGESAPQYVEGGTGAVATYTASNPARVTIMWTVTGPDAADFRIDQTGRLFFQTPPDFEAPLDGDQDNVYQVTVGAADGTSPAPGELPVRVTVEDARGEVRLSSSQPRVGSSLTATVSDPDGVDTVTAWCWEWSASEAGTTTRITCDSTNPTTTATYTPVETDLGRHLWATVTYTDSDGTFKEDISVQDPTGTVSARRDPPPPEIRGGGEVAVQPVRRTGTATVPLRRPTFFWPPRRPVPSVRPQTWITLP